MEFMPNSKLTFLCVWISKLKSTYSTGYSHVMPFFCLYTAKVLQSISETLDCRENFFREQEGGLCFPKCEKWQEFSPSEVMATDAIILLSAAVGIIAAVAVIIISIIRYKSMYVCTYV